MPLYYSKSTNVDCFTYLSPKLSHELSTKEATTNKIQHSCRKKKNMKLDLSIVVLSIKSKFSSKKSFFYQDSQRLAPKAKRGSCVTHTQK
uniref:Uncharacterized protein n=1 Tax=Rhizophora mucronata TaxID=61149 RepID=A0A2P2QTM8_RHIMU